MSIMSASNIIRAATLAWEVYRLGWSENLNASQQYQDFGQDVKDLAENLDNISKVIENARKTWAKQSPRHTTSQGLPQQKEWDLSSLREIIGDYQRTLRDCEKLLEENHEFRKNRNFTYNIKWNVVIQPKVEHLCKRLECHNSKISILLRPLELNLLSDIHSDLANRIDAVHRSIQHLQGLLIPDVEQALSQKGSAILVRLDVPSEIETRFQTAAERSYPDITAENFPLQAGADAFVAHFEESTKKFTARGNFIDERRPPAQQYLALLKSIWIMRHLSECDALRSRPENSQWHGYVQQLSEDLSMECQRFMAPPAQQLVAPDLSGLRNDDQFNIWPAENIADYISPHFELVLDEVLKVSMESPSESLSRDITIYRLGSTKYRLLESIEDKNTPSTRRKDFKMEIDLKTVNFTPLYAIPSSRPKALQVVIASPTADITPTFLELKNILRLQHLITGYKVYERYDQAMVTVSFFISGQATPVEEHGRLQLWLPHHFGSSSTSPSVLPGVDQFRANSSWTSLDTGMETVSLGNSHSDISSSRVLSSANPSSHFSTASLNMTRDTLVTGASRYNIATSRIESSSNPSFTNRSRHSITLGNARERTTSCRKTCHSSPGSINRSKESVTISNSRENTTSHQSMHSTSTKLTKTRRPSSVTPSTITTSSSTSHTTASSITTISTGTGRAHVHSKPAKPLLVIFLKSKEPSGKLAIVAIQIDDKTQVERERCKCRTSNSKCVDSCIERSGGCLLAQRWDADQKLGGWDLAKLGVEQRKELPADAWNDVKRVTMKFDSLEDRYKFSGSPCSCKSLMQHDLSRCIMEGHHGVFGIVKQIGSQLLRNYHHERKKAAGLNIVAAGLNIVLSSLPEHEP